MSAADFQKGMEAYEKGDYATALREWTALAEQDHARAQHNLGNMYREGQGVPQDDKQAVQWYTRAAEQGHAGAQLNLGNMYAKGLGVKQDDKQAVQWYTRAAEQGHTIAQFNLGNMYADGRGVLQDDRQAVHWYNQAAEQGDADARYKLGNMYAEGRGVPQDDKQAVRWTARAAEQDHAIAQFNLGVMYLEGQGVPQDDRQAVQWFTQAAEQGYADARYNLGLMYLEGQGVPQDDKQAVQWFTQAAEQNHASAQYNLGLMYAEGRGVSQNDRQAVHWFTRAAEQDNTAAQNNLGAMYREGRGVPKDDKQAAEWFTRAAEQDTAAAQFNLGNMYAEGQGVPQDDRQAVQWFTQAAEQGYADARYNLGLMYLEGQGVPQDDKQAVQWFTQAAEQDNAAAQSNLGVMYLEGQGVPQDDKQAVQWFTQAAEQGEADARYNLGVMYAEGQGVPQDDKQAVKWYTRAAEQGHALAQFNLGNMYARGDGVPEDDKQAAEWFTRAAEQDNAAAQSNLGVMYYYGRGVPQDDKQALKWYTQAAEKGYALAQFNLGVMYLEGQGVPQDDEQAVQWFTQAAEQGYALAQFNLGIMYAEGQGVPKDLKQAAEWFMRAAEQGYADAWHNLGLMYKGQERLAIHATIIWRIANHLRGSVNGWDFKQYVLGMLFYRFISENLASYINKTQKEAGDPAFNYAELSDSDAERTRDTILKEKGSFILPGDLFENVRGRAATDRDLNETLETVFRKIEASARGTENESGMKGLFDDLDVNSSKLGATVEARNEKLVKLLHAIGDLPMGKDGDNATDLFGDACEYLMTMYAANAGRAGGESFTPREVSELLARITVVGKQQVNKVYDPACGSGSLLLTFARVLGRENVGGFFGQEINITTYNLCRINMFLHGINYGQFTIAHGDTLTQPRNRDDEPFEAIVSNPPYSIEWAGDADPVLVNDGRFAPAGVLAPKSKADLAFVMHALSWLATNGTAAIVSFPGAMYRRGAEQKIRKYLVDNHYVDAVIQLPTDLFFGTSITTCILVLKKNKPDTRVLFMDATNEFVRGSAKNKLDEGHIEKILTCYANRETQAHFSHLATQEDIAGNDYSLSVGSYVEPEDTRERITIAGIKAIVARQRELRDRIDAIVADLEVNRIDDLIKAHCPNGVEFKPMGKVCVIADNNIEGYTHEGNYVLIAEDGSASPDNYSVQYTNGKFRANNHVHVIQAKDGLDNRFLFHYLTKERAKLTKAKMIEIPIPVPPLPVQREIVDILDRFTELEAEMEAELEARQKQYACYRNSLLSFAESHSPDGERETLEKAAMYSDMRIDATALTSDNYVGVDNFPYEIVQAKEDLAVVSFNADRAKQHQTTYLKQAG